MAKNSVSFSCSNCHHSSIKWLGCCPSCQEWNSFIEEKPHFGAPLGGKKTGSSRGASGELLTLRTLHEIEFSEQKRMLSGMAEWDNVLGGGIMPGSLLILTGDPGIGKSTLLLHVAHKLANSYSVFYFSSEESLEQVKLRAMRIGSIHDSLLFSDKANIEGIIHTSQERKPDIIIIDSIQNCFFSETQTFPGTVGQLRETSFALMRLAKEHGIAVIITCHITKEGHMAGPKTLEHMVDGVFYLQGEDRWHTRILRSVKNRFGAIHELGFFSMTESGMEEVPHINQFLLNESTAAAGAVLVSCLEGSRPLLLEIQALVVLSKFGVPQRVVTGLDHKRVVLIAAILEKYLHIKFSAHDIFVKVSGGLKLTESSSDLAIALALLSSYFQQALPEKSMALAEISLTGALKPINGIETQLKEAQKFGIKKIFVASGQKTTSTAIKAFSSVYQLLSLFDDSPDQIIQTEKTVL
jgi:DNA repair protein RadA/Sms